MKPRDRSFEEEVFIQLFHRIQRGFDVFVRNFKDVHVLGGSGNVWCNDTQARFWQAEMAYPFDPAELRKDNTKLCEHIARECYKDFCEMMAPHNIKPDARHRLFLLSTPELKPAWLEEHLHGELKGAYQLSLRLTLAAPDHLPFGPGGPALVVPRTEDQKTLDTDIHAAREQAARDTAHALKEQQREIENLTKIDLDAGRSLEVDSVGDSETNDKKGEPVE